LLVVLQLQVLQMQPVMVSVTLMQRLARTLVLLMRMRIQGRPLRLRSAQSPECVVVCSPSRAAEAEEQGLQKVQPKELSILPIPHAQPEGLWMETMMSKPMLLLMMNCLLLMMMKLPMQMTKTLMLLMMAMTMKMPLLPTTQPERLAMLPTSPSTAVSSSHPPPSVQTRNPTRLP